MPDQPASASQRPESGALGNRVRGLDGFRGVAILLVLVSHVFGLNGAGLVGVLVFFVLSGYLITTLLVRERQRAGRVDLLAFYWRRGLRLLPALVLFLALFLLGSASGRAGVGTQHALRGSALGLAYLTDIALAFQTDYVPELAHLWTLAVEEHFYVIWPIALIFLLRLSTERRLVWLLRLLVLAVVLRLATLAVAPMMGLFFYAAPTLWVESLLAGAACAVLMHDRPTMAARIAVLVRRPASTVVAVAAIAGFAFAPGSFTWPVTYLFGLPILATSACVIVLGVGEGLAPGVARLLGCRPLVVLGSLSYALYLYNSTCIMLAQRIWGESLTVRLVAVSVALSFALLSRHLVELPALHLKERRASAPLGSAVQNPASLDRSDMADMRKRPQPTGD